MNTNSKPWYLSKSAWIHGLTIAASGVAIASGLLPHTVQVVAITAGVSGAISLALRLLTSTAIAGSPADTQVTP
jgi:hypothetical protein